MFESIVQNAYNKQISYAYLQNSVKHDVIIGSLWMSLFVIN